MCLLVCSIRGVSSSLSLEVLMGNAVPGFELQQEIVNAVCSGSNFSF